MPDMVQDPIADAMGVVWGEFLPTSICPVCETTYVDRHIDDIAHSWDDYDHVTSIQENGACTDCVSACRNCGSSYWSRSDTFCESCAELDECARCGVLGEFEYIEMADASYCPSCVHATFYVCRECGDYVERGAECPSCDRGDDDNGYEDDADSRGIRSYSYKPEPIFRWVANGQSESRCDIEPGTKRDWLPRSTHVFMGFEL